MPSLANKVKVEFQDNNGRKVKIELSGNTTGQDLKRIYDFLHDTSRPKEEIETNVDMKDTKFQRFYEILLKQFAVGEFNSSDALLVTQEEFGIQLKHALVSTYLMRLVDRGLMDRKWSSSGWVYSLVKKVAIQ